MKENLVVSKRGQITLPATLRRALGIQPGDVVTVEERDGDVVLKPAVVLEVSRYTDDEIAAWDAADEFAEGEREAVVSRLTRGEPV
jgi:antitoxin PrlF